ncbi:hypothetical protein [Arcanobacterium phocae]|uniref:hypothetical protein n=1 Tax=Arcanobacterium phocae TaxID=131112 RepID=UPI001C0ED242|nr:hypothetical protein [Arcanobacterium phocae]
MHIAYGTYKQKLPSIGYVAVLGLLVVALPLSSLAFASQDTSIQELHEDAPDTLITGGSTPELRKHPESSEAPIYTPSSDVQPEDGPPPDALLADSNEHSPPAILSTEPNTDTPTLRLRNAQAASSFSCSVDAVYAMDNSSNIFGNGANTLLPDNPFSPQELVPSKYPNYRDVVTDGLAISHEGSTAFAFAMEIRTWGSPRNFYFHPKKFSQGVWTNIEVTDPEIFWPQHWNVTTGAIDPVTGDYYLGGFDGKKFKLYRISENPGNNGKHDINYVGEINVPDASERGGIAFDSLGNLHLASSSNIYTISHINLAQAALTNPEVSATSLTAQGTGITYGRDGRLFVVEPSTVTSYDPFTFDSAATEITGSNLVSVSSCGFPPMLTLTKNIVERKNPTDQFSLTIMRDSTVLASAETTGETTGLQEAQTPLTNVLSTKTYKVSETATHGANLEDYDTTLECSYVDNEGGLQVIIPQDASSNSTATVTHSITLPVADNFSSHTRISCQYTNTKKREPSFLSLSKTIRGDGSPQGWTLDAEIDTTSNPLGGTVTLTGNTCSGVTDEQGIMSGTPCTITLNSDNPTEVIISETPGPQTLPTWKNVGLTCQRTDGGAEAVKLSHVDGALHGTLTVLPGQAYSCQFVNENQVGTITWELHDADNDLPLTDSVWTIERETSPDVWETATLPSHNDVALNDITDCVSDPCPSNSLDQNPQPGLLTLSDLAFGKYRLVQSLSPPGYILASSIEFAIDSTFPLATPLKFTNAKATVPRIPFTGGTGADLFIFIGSGLLIVALSIQLLTLKKRPRTN